MTNLLKTSEKFIKIKKGIPYVLVNFYRNILFMGKLEPMPDVKAF